MVRIASCFILCCLVQLAVSDGYSKDKPSIPFQDGDYANTIPGSSGAGGWSYGPSGTAGYYGVPVSMDYVSRYYGPVAVPVVLPDGTLANTPEVAAARAAHLTALAKAKALWYGKMDDGSYDIYKYGDNKYHGASGAPSTYGSVDPWQANRPWSGPLAMTTVLPSGHLAETPDIAAARAAHLQALLKARQEADKWKASAWKQWD